MAKVFQVDTGGTLTSSLISYYKLEDVNDFYSTNNLTNNNTATFVTGKVNNCVNLVSASSQYLSITDAAQTGLDLNSDFSIFGWFLTNTANAYQFIATKNDFGTSNILSYSFGTDNANHLRLTISSNGTVDIEKMSTGTLNTATWYHVGVTYNKTAGTCAFYINGSASGTGSSLPTSINNTNVDFMVGAIKNNGTPSYFVNGKIDELGIWSKALSTTEITDLYNSGNGQTMTTSPAKLKTWNGVTKTSVKTINGVTIASVKTFNGVV